MGHFNMEIKFLNPFFSFSIFGIGHSVLVIRALGISLSAFMDIIVKNYFTMLIKVTMQNGYHC